VEERDHKETNREGFIVGYAEVIRVTPEQLDLCDSCSNQGMIDSGHTIYSNSGERLIFICFNCKEKIQRGEV